MCTISCNSKLQELQSFEVLNDDKTGLHFNNKLTPTENFNMFNYMYFYNGSGAGAGDFNNDGLIDLFFSSNQGDNKLYINEGKLHFKDVTKEAKIVQDHGWSTGVSVVDINNDGLLDIYICRVGQFEILKSKNQLLVCKGIQNGIPFYTDEAKQYGIDFSGFSTQAAFLDYDMDGDLDMYLLNHTVHQNASYAPRSNFSGTYALLSGDRLYRNDGILFTDVTKQSRINSTLIGYGLGISVADINLDGWPDLYIGNDFHENDYLYINQKDGTFADENNQRLMHTSKFSMGVDIADINNDGYPDIITMDMQPADPYILKRSLGDDDYDIFNYKISMGYNYQYSRNNLQFNRKNGMFSEVGLFSGVYATDWSWAPLWMDFDNDGLKDLFISNGIPKRLNDIDYVNFVSGSDIQQKIQGNNMKEKDMELIKKFPEIKIPNKFYKNQGNTRFRDIASEIKNDQSTFSNGAVYADFDNDGDLDVVVNNIGAPALLYENKHAKKDEKNLVAIKLTGPGKNRNAAGAKLILFANDGIRTYERTTVKGFMSSMETPLYIGLSNTKVDSAFLIWPDNSFERITVAPSSSLSFIYKNGLPMFDYSIITSFKNEPVKPVTDITRQVALNFLHKENVFNEFDREPSIPHMVSTEGPALAIADINDDGLEDVYIGSAKSFHAGIFLQQTNGIFIKTLQPEMLKDSMYENVDATWADVNNDGNIDLVVASGGNEYYGKDEHLLPRIYLNDGAGNLKKLESSFSNAYTSASCVVANDFNNDGYIDLFVGGRSVPWNYGEIPNSFLLQNDGTGKFKNVTGDRAKELSKIGMVTDAVWFDLDKDNDKDLILSCEWGAVTAFINTNGTFTKKQLTDKKGWWNFILPLDADGDGDIDLVAGNAGLNSRLHPSTKEPVRLYFNDFDDNGKKEQVLTYYLQGREVPFANKEEIQKEIPLIKKKFLYAEDFAKASLNEIFAKDKLRKADILTADYFENSILINNGKMNFSTQALPWLAQLTSYKDAVVIQANNDSLPDILLAGNFYENNIQMGRNDADFGTVLINKGNGKFSCESINGLQIKGQVRHVSSINISKQQAYIIVKNNDSAMVMKFR